MPPTNQLSALAPLDAKLIASLEKNEVALITREAVLRLTELPYRQRLEEKDAAAFMPPAMAAALIREGNRSVGTLTYGWGSGGNPDPSGEYLRAVQAALRSPQGAHIKALFWDYPSLFQHPPGGKRTPEQEAAFKGGMHDAPRMQELQPPRHRRLCHSAVSLTRATPPRPRHRAQRHGLCIRERPRHDGAAAQGGAAAPKGL
jgi:hypothetical protein